MPKSPVGIMGDSHGGQVTGFWVDCKQPLFFFDLVRGVHARASVEQLSWQTRETRTASPVSCL